MFAQVLIKISPKNLYDDMVAKQTETQLLDLPLTYGTMFLHLALHYRDQKQCIHDFCFQLSFF
jgi:hypothetical protein